VLRSADLRGFGGAATLVSIPQDINAVVIGHTKRVKDEKFTAARIFAIVRWRLARICRADDRAAAASRPGVAAATVHGQGSGVNPGAHAAHPAYRKLCAAGDQTPSARVHLDRMRAWQGAQA
jgi:hypothetical protein